MAEYIEVNGKRKYTKATGMPKDKKKKETNKNKQLLAKKRSENIYWKELKSGL